MKYPKNHLKIKFISCSRCVLVLSFMVSFCALGQNIYQFNDANYRIHDTITGAVTYDYYLKSNDTILNGTFSFQSNSENDYGKFQYQIFDYSGRFLNNDKDGDWKFQSKQLNTTNQTYISNYNVLVTTDGIEHQINANFNKGKANGAWSVIAFNFANSKPKDTLSKTYAFFKDSYIVGNFNAESSDYSLKGSFNNSGMFHGQWTTTFHLENEKIEDVRKFENGVLKQNLINLNGTTYEVVFEGFETDQTKKDGTWIDIELGNGYFEIFEISTKKILKDNKLPANFSLDEIIATSNNLIKSSVNSLGYYKDFHVWNAVPGTTTTHYGKFRVKAFKFSEEEQQLIINIKQKYTAINTIMDNFFSNPKMKALIETNSGISRINAIYAVYNDKSNQLDALLQKVTSNAFQFVDKDIIINEMLPKIKFNQSSNYSFQGEQLSLERNFPSLDLDSDHNLSKVSELVDFIYDDVLRQNELVMLNLSNSQKQELLQDFETAFIAKKDEVLSSFSQINPIEKYNVFHKELSNAVINYTNTLSASYNSLDLDAKKIEVENYISCLDTLLLLWDELVQFKTKVDRLDEEYTRISFNPFLMTDINERLKERVYKAYEEYLLPFVLNDLKNNLFCTALEDKIENLDLLYNRMMTIKDIDTKAEELQLRRVKDVEKIIRILNVKLN